MVKKHKSKILLWVDNINTPFTKIKHPILNNKNYTIIIWIKTYEEATQFILACGLPVYICIGQDLKSLVNEDTLSSWLENYCKINKKELPIVDSQNPNSIERKLILENIQNYGKIL